jgi:hypothetical protein
MPSFPNQRAAHSSELCAAINGKETKMTRNLRALGLALAAALVLGAVAASGASAEYKFTSGGTTANTFVTGEQWEIHQFFIGGQAIKCFVAKFQGTQSTTTTNQLTITPVYENCTYGETRQIDITMNGCTYLFTGTTNAEKHGLFHVKCPAGKVIEAHLTEPAGTNKCTITIAEQAATGGVTYTNNRKVEPDNVTVHLTTTVKLTAHGEGLLCNTIKAAGTGFYKGTITLRAYNDNFEPAEGAQVQLTVDGAPEEF